MKKEIKKVLVANRGEIAVRIIRACHDMGLKTVAIYSKADKESLHVLHADEAVCIGEASSTDSYLNIPRIISACEISHADAVHPGYGFLAENAGFASICESSGLVFIGPSSVAIGKLGDKVQAKIIANKAKCPTVPGSKGTIEDPKEALQEADRIGYPLMIKATAGGGGKGIRPVMNREEFLRNFHSARAEAEAAFNNPGVYLEKMIVNPRHIEIQVIADQHGNCVHLGERDCTMQRRRQKLIEETPSPVVTPKMRDKIGTAAVNLCKEAGYSSAGTVEFLLDEKGEFYFMEVNTRIQVEHTVTEELSGVDLVREQLRVAMGEKLTFKQKDVQLTGHVIQFRINAEDPRHNFRPSPGKLEFYSAPGGPHVRVDSACYSGYVIPPNYDSMVAKLIVKGKTRQEAIAVAKRALREFHVGPVHTTIQFHQYMMEDPAFVKGTDYNLNYVDSLIEKGCTFELPEEHSTEH